MTKQSRRKGGTIVRDRRAWFAVTHNPDPGAFDDIDGFPEGGYGETYSWNTGMVIVPAYDTTTGANGENITANMGVGLDGVSIISWHVQ